MKHLKSFYGVIKTWGFAFAGFSAETDFSFSINIYFIIALINKNIFLCTWTEYFSCETQKDGSKNQILMNGDSDPFPVSASRNRIWMKQIMFL